MPGSPPRSIRADRRRHPLPITRRGRTTKVIRDGLLLCLFLLPSRGGRSGSSRGSRIHIRILVRVIVSPVRLPVLVRDKRLLRLLLGTGGVLLLVVGHLGLPQAAEQGLEDVLQRVRLLFLCWLLLLLGGGRLLGGCLLWFLLLLLLLLWLLLFLSRLLLWLLLLQLGLGVGGHGCGLLGFGFSFRLRG
ncbi:uncharacterized protein B0T15DRAFT_312799 [Chaetomium strumarium]|uniref:Uncharacterized protein n=1 Tax=Chaetomium strumarium TaxID=1170767 RepID=A0AAJ0GMJ5_9PEZI|nr:hypothetical protein B0T15DRAFT_312799 [Chaetomium strumarium]